MTDIQKDSHQEILDRTGIMEGADESLYRDEGEQTEEPTKEPEEKKPDTSTQKQKPEPEEDAEEEESEDEGDEDEEDEDEQKEEKSSSKRPKNTDPMKAMFGLFKDLRKEMREELKDIRSSLTPKEREATEEAEDTLDKTLKQLEEEGFETGPLKKFGDALVEKITKNLKTQGLSLNDLPEELRDALKNLSKLSEKDKKVEMETADAELFTGKWNDFLPTLSKQYPNATKEMMSEARDLMDEISHSAAGGIVNEKSQTITPYDFEYILYKNRTKFDTLLKVAKSHKSGETESKTVKTEEEYETPEDDSDIDLDPENMDPTKMKKWEERKLKNKDKFGKN